jgi:hypothetical protein
MLSAEDKETIRQLIREVVREETEGIVEAMAAKIQGNALPVPGAPLLPSERQLEIRKLAQMPREEANKIQLAKAHALRKERRGF